jgi:hypothetical protein
MLAGYDVEFHDAAGDRRINVGMHLHGFQCQKFSTSLDGMVNLHGDAPDESCRGCADLAGVRGIPLGMRAFNDAERAVAKSDLKKRVLRAVGMCFSDGEKLQDHRFAGLDFGLDFLAGLQVIEESGRWQNAEVSVCLAELVVFQSDGLFSARENGNAGGLREAARGDFIAE